jgi:hypothetical protein
MGFLRDMFGPSREEIWRQVCSEIDAQYVDGGFWKGDKVQARHGQWTITLDVYAVSHNSGKTHSTTHYTRLRAPYVNKDGFRFTIYRKSFFSDIGKWFGMQDVEVGHAEFDEAFIIKGNDEQKLRELFADENIRQLLEMQSAANLTVKDDEGWFASTFPDGVDELHFSTLGVIKDVDRLKSLYYLFAAVLDRLCQIGSAYQNNPNVDL